MGSLSRTIKRNIAARDAAIRAGILSMPYQGHRGRRILIPSEIRMPLIHYRSTMLRAIKLGRKLTQERLRQYRKRLRWGEEREAQHKPQSWLKRTFSKIFHRGQR